MLGKLEGKRRRGQQAIRWMDTEIINMLLQRLKSRKTDRSGETLTMWSPRVNTNLTWLNNNTLSFRKPIRTWI